MDALQPAQRTEPMQILCFALAGEAYGIPILKVREIQATAAITRIPRAPAFMPGVINLRGAIVPILDLRVRFALGDPPEGGRPVMIIVEVQGRTLGIRVDAVSEVVDLDPARIQPPPDWGGEVALDREFISGLAHLAGPEGEDGMLILLDLDRLLSPDELKALNSPDGL